MSTTSSTSPTLPYRISTQTQQQPPHSDSPNHTMLSHHKSTPHSADQYIQTVPIANTTHHPMYNSMNNIHLASPDYTSLSSMEPDALNFQTKANGFAPAPFRTSTSFNPFSSPAFGPPSADTFNTSSPLSQIPTSPTQQAPQSYSFEAMHHLGRVHDYAVPGSQSSTSGAINGIPQSFGGLDPYRQGLDSASLQQNHQTNQQGPGGMLTSTQASQLSMQHQVSQQSYQGAYPNGISHLGHGPHTALQSQTQFGPTLPAVSAGSGPSAGAQSTGLGGASGMNHVNGSAQNSQPQEEISTIFVVGFPDDMQEREFQNMFTFSPGFEAATLKIPNKEFTAYGAGTPTVGGRLPYPGSNDPYNLVTVNQGGVVVDGGRDGTTTSWPAAAPLQPNDDGHYLQSNVPAQTTRKQIIGFAKFRSRQEAIDARDTLQGRRVDIERGAVLKAEMAKKNLHTKRGPGVGPLGIPLGSLVNGQSGPGQAESLSGIAGLNGIAGIGPNSGTTGNGEPFAQRDRELGVLGAMGIALNQRRMMDGREDEERSRRPDVGVVGLGALGTRGARERAEEDERERERKRKEREALRLRQNSFAFEAFHSVPQQMVRQGANSLLSVESGHLLSGTGLPSPQSTHSVPPQPEGFNGAPWGSLRDVSASAALRKMSMLATNLPARPSSPLSQISPGADTATNPPSAPVSASSQNGSAMPGSRSAPFSPQSSSSSLPSHPSLPSRPRPYSPGSEPQPQPSILGQVLINSSIPTSSASSVSGSQSGNEEELSRSVAALAVSTAQGTTSPQLPSPSSGASSGTGRNSGDQNPPINTLYVGNLPTSSTAGVTSLNFLEDRLRDLFSKRPGYRKLIFRQKSNGPMCFVEFEDVSLATKAINELSGHTLNGLVKSGGIRLSYSKNPLGVRTPTSSTNASSLQQQQQQIIAHGQSFMGDVFPQDAGRSLRRDMSGMTSPTTSYHYTTSPPPPRFVSPPPSAPFVTPLSSSTAFPRANPQGYGMTLGGSSSFSPFGISPSRSTIPDQPSADANHDYLPNLSSSAANIEAGRVG
ncbi:hypothetical protein SCP_0213180 [Sparassis crispa]|uniref:RRM domain-containing protein n=1 Tax=Sparassis crispa TaxID=139825 RepID=A0A401GD96_9APHY|nr:hypothetical protein SCP_0213180 [Sparassis crispa]GBE80115.1 hypothetical protein SCP_0213180 [Sparassis crispa]